MTDWEEWASGVLGGVGAPVDTANVDSLWAWSNAESGTVVMRWNNPLNTTEPWPGAQIMNSVGVKRYASVNDGVLATVATLDNGYYPTILSLLRSSTPRADWTPACHELGTWGTGCGWLLSVYGAVPGDILAADMTPEEHQMLVDNHERVRQITAALQLTYTAGHPEQSTSPVLDAIVADLAALKASGGSTVAPALKLGGSFSGTLTAE